MHNSISVLFSAGSCSHHSPFRRAPVARHAGINSKKMLGRAKHGFRERVVDLCPRISDWEELWLDSLIMLIGE